ncbi:hypothetical protein EST38_g14046 [Candolleomyces aberdarensis]|uniref:Nephrocystin 3-like N-terminal domain-containing protein n=1 Tax=Candolleomyces aberdarensis TaxID=2316362 RepID=A0A4Q2CZ97_9AGAR|nr:hypothetical protein EST38_g14046 [Candolleomyces aberdarensis]
MASNFNKAHNFQIDNYHYVNVSPSTDPLSRLEVRITASAIHDSAERCDAPKCHPDTRVAAQDDLYSWIVDGDGESEHPMKMKWVTGPAGSGKTAVMGSLADRCRANGLLGASFFFASWSASIGRRRKTSFVSTIAYQLAEYGEDLKNAISHAIEKSPSVFEKNLHVQMETLVLAPLRDVALQPDRKQLQGAIIIDGVDECEAEQYHDESRVKLPPTRTNDRDQLEILQVLQVASSDCSFPFRILIASRPERVFREFFDPENNLTPFAHKLDLHEDYNADADITLFLEAQFNRLRRRYNLHPSWLPPNAVKNLVDRASGQFIYASTVIRFLETGHWELPKGLLEAVLNIEAKMTSNPLEQLDALYSHILESSPNPLLSVRWIRSIQELNRVRSSYASNIHLLLQMDPESNEAEHLLGNLHSLIRVPPLSKQAAAEYSFYHKSLFDFLRDSDRCGKLHIQYEEALGFLWDRFNRSCATSADWWVLLAISLKKDESLWAIFREVHTSVRTVLNALQILI